MICYDNGELWLRLVWIAAGVILFCCALLLIGVMQKCEHDPSNKRDAGWIKSFRRWGFIQSTLIVLGVILAIWYGLPPALMVLGMAAGCCYHLAVNYVALRRRETPGGTLHAIPPIQGAGTVSTRVRRGF